MSLTLSIVVPKVSVKDFHIVGSPLTACSQIWVILLTFPLDLRFSEGVVDMDFVSLLHLIKYCSISFIIFVARTSESKLFISFT